MYDFNIPMDKTSFLQMVGGRQQVPRNDVFLPDWPLTVRKSEILTEFKDDGENQANHACTCTATDCPWHFVEKPTWLTPGYFRQWLLFTLDTMAKRLPPVPEDPEAEDRGKEMRDMLEMYTMIWREKSDEQVMADPRYRAYECGFNSKLLEFISASLSYRVPEY